MIGGIKISSPFVPGIQDYDKYSYPLRKLRWDIDEIINLVLFLQKEWEENHYTLFNHNVNREGIAI